MVQTVVGRPTSLTLTSSQNPAPYATPVVLTAIIADASGNPVSGTVSFHTPTLELEDVAVDSMGKATWTNGASGFPLPVGTQAITAGFEGTGYAISYASVAQTFTSLGTLPTPTFSPPGGTYTSVVPVSLVDSALQATIYYTMDGSPPIVGASRPYSGTPIQVGASVTINAIAGAPGYTDSPPVSAGYVINLPPPDFTMSLSPAALTIHRGQSGATTLTILPQNGLSDLVSFSCSGLPAGVSCTFFPGSVPAGGTSSVEVSVSQNTSSNDAPGGPVGPVVLASIMLASFHRRKRRSGHLLRLFMAAGTLMICMSGCGGGGASASGSPSVPQPLMTTITITASSASVTHVATLALTID